MNRMLPTALVPVVLILLGFAPKKQTTIQFELDECRLAETVYLYEFNGFGFEVLDRTQLTEGKGTLTLDQTKHPRIYYIGETEKNLLPIVLGTEKEVRVTGSTCREYKSATAASKLNEDYRTVKAEMTDFVGQSNRLSQSYRRTPADNVDVRAELTEQMAALDRRKTDALKKWQKRDDFLGSVLELNTYYAYPSNSEGFDSEIDYFAKTYFQNADWKSDVYAYQPWVYEATKAYANTLSSVRLDKATHQAYLDAIFEQLPAKSRQRQLAYAGVLTALEVKQHENYAVFAKRAPEELKGQDELVARIEEKAKRLAFASGEGAAPNIKQATPEGGEMALSELRGKYVLLDFWASWCGPCRRENPNVVAMYQKYHKKGFDIFSVSLDKDKGRWLQAIEKDNMTWHHVSDLRGWANEAAAIYGVRSIPRTFLLDPEGNIIAKNLRGEALQAKLAEIFGS